MGGAPGSRSREPSAQGGGTQGGLSSVVLLRNKCVFDGNLLGATKRLLEGNTNVWNYFCCAGVDFQEILLPAAISSLPYHVCGEAWCSGHFRVLYLLLLDEITQRSFPVFSPTASRLPVPVLVSNTPTHSIWNCIHRYNDIQLHDTYDRALWLHTKCVNPYPASTGAQNPSIRSRLI